MYSAKYLVGVQLITFSLFLFKLPKVDEPLTSSKCFPKTALIFLCQELINSLFFYFLKRFCYSGIYVSISTGCTRPLTGNPLSAQVPVLESRVIIGLFTKKHFILLFSFCCYS